MAATASKTPASKSRRSSIYRRLFAARSAAAFKAWKTRRAAK